MSSRHKILADSNQNEHITMVEDDDDADADIWKDAEDQFIDEVKLKKPTSTQDFNKHKSNQNVITNNLNTDFEAESDDLRLHKAIFENDLKKIYDILKDKGLSESFVNKKDKHGNTPLHLACMMGRPKEVVKVLLKTGASVECRNLNRWTPFHEACSYGDREIITLMIIQLGNNFHDSLNHQKLAKQLMKQRNYRVVLKWEFKTFVPFVSKFLPNDVCVITKQGGNIRIDTRLLEVGSEMMSMKKADGCLIYCDSLKKWIIMNKMTKKFQFTVLGQGLNPDIDKKVDDFMSTDIIDIELESSDIVLTRSTSGWIWKADKAEKIGKYDAALYEFNQVFLVTRKRREHLSDEDLKRNKRFNKSAMDLLKFGGKKSNTDTDGPEDENDDDNAFEDMDDNDSNSHRPSLPPPPKTNVTWTEYCNSDPGCHPSLGREQKIKVTKTPFKAGLAVSDQFPLTKNEFIDLLSVIPLKLFKKLKDFIEMRLPDGFPIRVDVPIFPFLTARITLEDFEFLDGPIDESLFRVPDDYVEEIEPMLPIFQRTNKESNGTDS